MTASMDMHLQELRRGTVVLASLLILRTPSTVTDFELLAAAGTAWTPTRCTVLRRLRNKAC
ncbi:MAG: hypothetical protein R2687_09670 [Candidatus Nanopelagicales bacterium]